MSYSGEKKREQRGGGGEMFYSAFGSRFFFLSCTWLTGEMNLFFSSLFLPSAAFFSLSTLFSCVCTRHPCIMPEPAAHDDRDPLSARLVLHRRIFLFSQEDIKLNFDLFYFKDGGGQG